MVSWIRVILPGKTYLFCLFFDLINC